MVWKFTFITIGDRLECYYFITHVRNCVMGATPMSLGPNYFIFIGIFKKITKLTPLYVSEPSFKTESLI